jgi:hypothetical protein
LTFSIDKNPIENTLIYNYNYTNEVDLSDGQLKNLKISISDNSPLQINSVQETISGFQASQVISRSLGKYSLSAKSDDSAQKLQTLKDVVSGFCSGSHVISESFQTGENSISYNISKYY